MRELDFPGGWYCDARPDGRFAVIMADRVITNTGDLPLLDGARPLYVRLAESGLNLAGQHERTNHALEWDGQWTERPEIACGTSGVIYDRANVLHAADCAVVGVNGYRYIAEDGRLVTGDETYAPKPHVPWICEWTDLGDGLYIGQGQPWGIVLWDGQYHRVLIPPDGPECRFIRARRAGDLVSLAWYSVRGNQYTSHFRWPSVAELRSLPVYQVPASAPSPGPGTPNPTPPTPPAPAPEPEPEPQPTPAPEPEPAPVPEPPPAPPLPPEMPPVTDDNAPYTLKLEGAQSAVMVAYRTLLGRDPDPDGEAHYLRGLMDGTLTVAEMEADMRASAEYAEKQTPPAPEPGPVPPGPSTAVVRFPALMASYYASPTDPDLDIPVFARWLQEHGCTATRGWLLDAWAVGQRDGAGKFLPGQYDGFLPMRRRADGVFDLFDWNPAYFEHLRFYAQTLNAHGVWPHLTILELYSWSQRKAGLLFVPDPNLGPFRNNVNGVRWGDPDDRTFGAEPENNPDQLPDAWLREFIRRVVDTLQGCAWAAEVGNEFPEKGLHWRVIDVLRLVGFAGEVTVNRNDDTPGQYWNMKVGERFDRIALHNFMSIDYLDEEHPREAEAGRPTTFRAMWDQVDPARIIVSSDGGGGNPKHLPTLAEVARDTLRRGGSYEHQLALKRRRFYGDGSLQMADLEIDSAFLKGLR